MSTTTPTTLLQNSPYLQQQRQFPSDDLKQLSKEVHLAYIDIAQKMNARRIGIFSLNYQLVTGDSWYLQGNSKRQQSLTQVYQFTAAGNIPHGINFAAVSQFLPNTYGSFTDGTNYYGAPYGSSTPIAGQVSFYVTPTNIVVLAGAGAPTITSGIIALEWLSQY